MAGGEKKGGKDERNLWVEEQDIPTVAGGIDDAGGKEETKGKGVAEDEEVDRGEEGEEKIDWASGERNVEKCFAGYRVKWEVEIEEGEGEVDERTREVERWDRTWAKYRV